MHHLPIARRQLLLSGLIAAFGNSTIANESVSQTRRLLPDPATFETGDLLWPKPKDAYIPYASDSSFEQEKARWEAEKSAFTRQLFSKSALSSEEQKLLHSLSALAFEEFYARYVENQKAEGQFQPYGTVTGVGHVAILKIVPSKAPIIIEAMPGDGVRTIGYSQWLASRSGQEVYHGRLSDVPQAGRAKIADHAEAFILRPYGFWNFNLSDVSSFYCSKLAWLSAFRATRIAIDGDEKPQRGFWLSPKQLIRSDKIAVLFAPGRY